jgi:hypothetical protein
MTCLEVLDRESRLDSVDVDIGVCRRRRRACNDDFDPTTAQRTSRRRLAGRVPSEPGRGLVRRFAVVLVRHGASRSESIPGLGRHVK